MAHFDQPLLLNGCKQANQGYTVIISFSFEMVSSQLELDSIERTIIFLTDSDQSNYAYKFAEKTYNTSRIACIREHSS